MMWHEEFNDYEAYREYHDSIDSVLNNMCFEFDVYKIVKYFLMYALLRFVTKKYKKRQVLSSNLVSMYVCWRFLLVRDFSDVIAYYWYDLVLSIVARDPLMVLHHLVSLFGLQQCFWHPDYESIRLGAVLLKSGDLFLHHYKITDALELYNRFPLGTRIYQACTVFATILLWLYFRVFRALDVYPFETSMFHFVAVVFHCLNMMWIVKLCILLFKTIKRFSEELYRSID